MTVNQIRLTLFSLFIVFWLQNLKAQEGYSLNWLGIQKETLPSSKTIHFLAFEGCTYHTEENLLPWFYTRNPSNGQSDMKVKVEVLSESKLELTPWLLNGVSSIGAEPLVKTYHEIIKGKSWLRIGVLPLYKKGNSIYKIESFKLIVRPTGQAVQRGSSRNSYASNSVLSGGTWYKMAITEDGIYKIDDVFLKSIGVNPKNVSLDNLRIYGNGGGMLPESNQISRVDDLLENPVYISSSGKVGIEEDDYALFYAQGPYEWRLNASNRYSYIHNIYSDTNYYFLTFDGGVGTPHRISDQSSVTGTPVATYSNFNDFQSHELDLSNLIGSGKKWFGENFGIKTNHYIEFEFPNIVQSQKAHVEVIAAMRSVGVNGTLNITVNGLGAASIVGGNVGSSYLDTYATEGRAEILGNPSSGKLGVSLNYSKPNSEALAWLDKITVNCMRSLQVGNSTLHFQVIDQKNKTGTVEFNLSNVTSFISIWDITNPTSPKNQVYQLNGREARFLRPGGKVERFIAFAPSMAKRPVLGFKIPNQNLHAVAQSHPNMVIFTPAELSNYADQVADYHRETDGFEVAVIDVRQVYNEFSSGRQDITALRDFMRMLYKTATTPDESPKYLLLFGDASFDYKDRISGNTNLVPIYQFSESYNPIGSIATDDYFAMVDDNFNGDLIAGVVQFGVGRFIVKNERQAAQAVAKLLSYNSEKSLGRWRLKASYIADDEDGNLHMEQASNLADTVDFLSPTFNVQKILSDAFTQQSTPGGHRYPEVNRLIDESVERGALTVNYVGHGGELGLAEERILEVPQINKWNNPSNLPLFVTATCEFSRFDDPRRTSAGEFVFLNPDGGGIGLLSTTRVVYATPNYSLAQAFNQIAYTPVNGTMPRLGDIVQQTKTRPGNFNANTRAFALMGDPALRLNYPKHFVRTVSRPDTLGSLQKVTISGEVVDKSTGALLSGFNGTVYPTVYDKKKKLETLNNDNGPAGSMTFRSRVNILFRGKVAVTGGKFSFTFVVPKDIDLNFGQGKISYYADNGKIDAAGFDTTIVVGGRVGDPTADQIGPEVNLYLNDTTFVFGGMTNESPMLLAKVFDENGINTSGSGIGHDIVAVLDENTSEEIVLNDYYETVLNSYQRGVVQYPFKELTEGKHKLSIKAWDVYNNSGEDNTEFVVSKSAELALAHVLNYPNPFTTKTDFYFEHNYPNEDLSVRVQIFTVSGKIVKTIDGFYNSQGFRIGPITWDGRDDFGDKIGKGVYVYKVEVKAPNGETADKFEKLVILN